MLLAHVLSIYLYLYLSIYIDAVCILIICILKICQGKPILPFVGVADAPRALLAHVLESLAPVEVVIPLGGALSGRVARELASYAPANSNIRCASSQASTNTTNVPSNVPFLSSPFSNVRVNLGGAALGPSHVGARQLRTRQQQH